MLSITLHAAGYEATFLPAVGGACISLKKGDHEIFHHFDTLEEIVEKPTSYGLPVLFPPNRLDGGTFTFEGRKTQLPINNEKTNVSCHGFLHTRPWQVEGYSEDEEQAEIHLVFEGGPDCDFYEEYPYDFEAEQVYTLDAQGLHQEIRITNFSEYKMPFGLGWHSAFAVNPEHGVRVQVSLGQKILQNERMLPTGEVVEPDAQEKKFASEGQDPMYRAFDDHYTDVPMMIDGKPFRGAILTDPVTKTQVVYRVDDFYKHWMIWNCNQEGSFVCIEPQDWRTNAPNLPLSAEESGLDVLEPDETISITADVYLKG